MIAIDYKDARPIYEQIVDRYIELILKGVLKKDEQMPSVRSLAMDLSINPNTIQKSYIELERRGYIYSVKGRGSFVASSGNLLEQRRTDYIAKIKDIAAQAVGYGIEVEVLIEAVNSVATIKRD